MQILGAKLNLSKIPKDKIFEGKSGKLIDITITIFDNKDEYGNNVSITVAQTEEQRKAKATKTYLGNGKVLFTGEAKAKAESQPEPIRKDGETDDTLPF